jgi:hypothetical protein
MNEELERLFAEAAALLEPGGPGLDPVVAIDLQPGPRSESPRGPRRPPVAAAEATFPEAVSKPTMRPLVPILTVLDDGSLERGEEIRIRKEVFTIGRCEGDLVLPHDPALSSQHAEIRLTDHRGLPRWSLRDTGSTNHTFVRVGSGPLTPDTLVILGTGRYRLRPAAILPAAVACSRPEVTSRVAAEPRQPAACDALLEVSGSEPGRAFPLLSPQVAIGRDARRCQIQRDDPSLAGLHAECIREPDGSWRIVAAPSLNGVWMSTRSTRLTACCYFQCGEQRFKFVVP